MRRALVVSVFVASLAACSGEEPPASPSASPTRSPSPTAAATATVSVSPTATATGSTGGPPPPPAVPADVQAAAITLRTQLTTGLVEHAFLTGQALRAALDGSDARAASEALDASSVALSDIVAGVYGPDLGAAFLELWRAHVGFLVDAAEAAAEADPEAQAQARADLDGFRAGLGELFAGVNPRLAAGTVAEAFVPYVQAMLTLVDASVAGDGQAFTLLRDAAQTTPAIAATLTVGIAGQSPDRYPGGPVTPAAELRVTLNQLLLEHAHLVTIATGTALAGDVVDPALAAVDTNSAAFGDVLGAAYGEQTGAALLDSWRGHIDAFVNYGIAAAAQDLDGAAAARAALDGFRTEFATLLAAVNPHLAADATAAALVAHVDTTLAVIDAQAPADPAAFALQRQAGAALLPFADTLANATVQQFPDRFGG